MAYAQWQTVQQVEKILFLVTELSTTLENQNERLEEMEKAVIVAAKLVVSLVELLSGSDYNFFSILYHIISLFSLIIIRE